MFKDKNIVLGVTGGIAAFKALDLVSKLKKRGATIDVIMTRSACEFVAPLSFQSLAHTSVVIDTFDSPKYFEIEHIALAKKADLFVIAPATANIIGKINNGIADDMLSTTVMATKAPVLIAPAMNTNMYENPIVQSNIAALRERGYVFVEPAEGLLACDDVGKGKLAAVDDIIGAMENVLQAKRLLKEKKILITAGATIEPLDPVRFISNHSTGKMGYALAEKAVALGAEVTLLSGKTNLKAPKGAEFIRFQTALELYDLVMAKKDDYDVLLSVAAVGDYRPESIAKDKIKKQADDLVLKLVRNPDIAFEVGQNKGNLLSVGFSAETANVLANSKQKLTKKNFDLLVINDLTEAGAGFAHDTNVVTLMQANGKSEKLSKMSKLDLAVIILERIAELLSDKNGN